MASEHTKEIEQAAATPPGETAPKKGRRKLVIVAMAVVALALSGLGAAYATGLVGKAASKPEAATAEASLPGAVDLPEIVANLNSGSRRTAFVRLKARLELASKSDEPIVTAALPRIQDLFQTYLRDMRPQELQASAGSYRLREELIARANIAVAPGKVTEILFIELLVQ